jgi:hypothetical protein
MARCQWLAQWWLGSGLVVVVTDCPHAMSLSASAILGLPLPLQPVQKLVHYWKISKFTGTLAHWQVGTEMSSSTVGNVAQHRNVFTARIHTCAFLASLPVNRRFPLFLVEVRTRICSRL